MRIIQLADRHLRRADDLVIGEHERHLIGARHALPRDHRQRAVGADHGAGADRLFDRGAIGAAFFVNHQRGAVVLMLDALVHAGASFGAVIGGALAQPFIEFGAIDHADETAIDRHIDAMIGRRDHARRSDLGDQHMIGDGEIADRARRDRTAAGLDAPCPVEQHDFATILGEIIGSGRPGGTAADDHDVVGLRARYHVIASATAGEGIPSTSP